MNPTLLQIRNRPPTVRSINMAQQLSNYAVQNGFHECLRHITGITRGGELLQALIEKT